MNKKATAKPTGIFTYYYSPTNTTKAIVGAIAKGTGISDNQIYENNLTPVNFENNIKHPKADDLVIIAGPVYAGRIAKTALDRLNKIKFANNPTILVAVYGNRYYDDALADLKEFAQAKGLKSIAAGAFIGEHSYSNSKFPVALGRPDEKDLKIAANFGQKAINSLKEFECLDEMPEIEVPGTVPLPERKKIPPMFAETIEDKCIVCGKCKRVCPTGAIYLDGVYKTRPELCTVCCACLKVCPEDARVIKSEFLQKIRNTLMEKCSKRKEPEVFIQK